MVWWIRTQEIARGGIGVGKYRQTATSDEDGGGPYGLCDHEHDTAAEASACPDAAAAAERY